jgi:hypothetical protein
MENRNELVWNFVLFDHLDLFRISDFEFRAFSLLLIPWRALRPFDVAQGMLCASDLFSDPVFISQKFQISLARCLKNGVLNRNTPRTIGSLLQKLIDFLFLYPRVISYFRNYENVEVSVRV